MKLRLAESAGAWLKLAKKYKMRVKIVPGLVVQLNIYSPVHHAYTMHA